MVIDLKQSKDVCIEKLTSTEGLDLEIMANLTSHDQLAAVQEGYIAMALHSRYGARKYQMLLRATVSYQARGRDDLTGIGKTPESTGWMASQQGGGTL